MARGESEASYENGGNQETQSSAGLRLLRESLRAVVGDWVKGASRGARNRQHTRVQVTRAHIDTTYKEAIHT